MHAMSIPTGHKVGCRAAHVLADVRLGSLCSRRSVGLCRCHPPRTCSRFSYGTLGSMPAGCSTASPRTSTSGNRPRRVGPFVGEVRPFEVGAPANTCVRTHGHHPTRFQPRRSRGESSTSPPGRTSTASSPSTERSQTSTTPTYQATSTLGLLGCTGRRTDSSMPSTG